MVTGLLVEMLERNTKHAQDYQSPPSLPDILPHLRATKTGVVIISCSDARLNPYQIFGIDPTLNAMMIRNAGGRAFDAIRTLAVLQTVVSLGTIVVMHHTDCGLTHFCDADVKKALVGFAPAEKDGIEASRFGEIRGSIEDSVREDVALLKASPLIEKGTQIVGLKFDTFSGRLSVVEG